MSSIEWTDVTWGPIRGCSRVSEGCRNCYAERMAARYSGPGLAFEGFARAGKWTGRVELIPEKLDEPLRWRKPQRVFVNSMSDLFHEALPDEAIDRVFAVMAMAERHTFQVLTKRPSRMAGYLADGERQHEIERRMYELGGDEDAQSVPAWPLPNVWLGVSVEDQAMADERIPLLLQTPAAVRFVSLEPLLGPVKAERFLTPWCWRGSEGHSDRGECNPTKLNWAIVGGESGPGARAFDVAWARSVVRQCREAGVPCFVKQLGARPVAAPLQDDEVRFRRRQHSKGGDPAEWPEDLRVREFPR